MASSGCTDFVRSIGEVIGLDVLLTKDARHRGFLCEDGHYRVLLHGGWINVPNSSVVTEPNRYGPAVVSTYMDSNGSIYIRCFLPGAGYMKRALADRQGIKAPQDYLGHRNIQHTSTFRRIATGQEATNRPSMNCLGKMRPRTMPKGSVTAPASRLIGGLQRGPVLHASRH